MRNPAGLRCEAMLTVDPLLDFLVRRCRSGHISPVHISPEALNKCNLGLQLHGLFSSDVQVPSFGFHGINRLEHRDGRFNGVLANPSLAVSLLVEVHF